VIYAKVVNGSVNGFLQSVQQMGFGEHLGGAEVSPFPFEGSERQDDCGIFPKKAKTVLRKVVSLPIALNIAFLVYCF